MEESSELRHCATPSHASLGRLMRSRSRRRRTASWTDNWRTLGAAGEWTTSREVRRLGSVARRPRRLWLVMMPRPLWSAYARTFESLYEFEIFCTVGGCGEHRKSVRRCTRRNETSLKGSSGKDGTAADACRRSNESASGMRTMRWAFERPMGRTRAAIVTWWR